MIHTCLWSTGSTPVGELSQVTNKRRFVTSADCVHCQVLPEVLIQKLPEKVAVSISCFTVFNVWFEILGVVIFKRLFFGNQRREKKSIFLYAWNRFFFSCWFPKKKLFWKLLPGGFQYFLLWDSYASCFHGSPWNTFHGSRFCWFCFYTGIFINNNWAQVWYFPLVQK